jgi:hypothetical protein
MHHFHCCWGTVNLHLLFGILPSASAFAQEVFTVHVGGTPPAPAPLVEHVNPWHYRKGTTAPQFDWKTAAEAALDGTWSVGPGGFGYGDGDDATALGDMRDAYSTVYVRQSFEIAESVEPMRRLRLVMDWDDGFVAWLDGVEIARSPNAPGPVGGEPAFDATSLPPNHEASASQSGNPPTTYDLGPVGDRLPPGTHVLAVMGLNGTLDSSDFSLIADLSLVGGQGALGGGTLFAIADTNSVQISGTNTLPASVRVVVNGEDAVFDRGSGLWSKAHALAPGMNHLFIAALDRTGAILASSTRAVLYEASTAAVGGVLNADTVWDGAAGTIHVTNTVIVPDGVTLTITNGAVVLLSPGSSIRATTNGAVLAVGIEFQPVLFGPADGETPWAHLGAFGTNASLTLRYAEVVAGQIRPVNGGSVLIEDSVIRDLNAAGTEVIAADNGGGLIMRRCYGARFGEMDASETPVWIEDSLLEHFAVDGLDIKGTNVSLVVFHTTVRFGNPTNSNADGIDFGPGAGVVDSCLIHGFPDKGISLGGAPGTQVHETLIYQCGSGIAVTSSTNCSIGNTTISGCATGLFFRTSGANRSQLVGTNNIVWGNSNNVVLTANSVLELTYSDVEGGFPGEGNIDADPLFVDAGRGNYRLAPDSPARGAGLVGVDMGPNFSFSFHGGLPSAPFDLAALVLGTNTIELVWQENADNEARFELERSVDGTEWQSLASVDAGLTNFSDTTAAIGQRYFYRVRAANMLGRSRFSNLASAIRQEPVTVVGGTLMADTIWSPADGTILVANSVIVPTNVWLTLQPGTIVKVTNNASIRAVAGGTINIAGTADSKVRIMGADGTNSWGELSAQFAGASLIVRHAEIARRQTTVYSNAFGLFEDSYFHDYRLVSAPGGPPLTTFSQPIFLTRSAMPVTVRRCHFREYYETLFRNGVMTIEECLFENIFGDGLDFDSAQPGTVLRRCTFRHGERGNVDAVDIGPGDVPGSFDVMIEDCLIYHFPRDKGVSVGDFGSSSGTVIRNCLIYDCLSGVQAKDSCPVTVYNCTITDNRWGFTNYNKSGQGQFTGGHTTNFNNILWDNAITVSLRDNGTLTSDHSDLGNTNWAGTGNIDADPLFANPAERDYRLQPGSPCLGTGRNGADMGARFPVGAPMALSHPQIGAFEIVGGEAVVRFWADSERSYSLLCNHQVAGGSWIKLADVPTGTVPRFVSVTNMLAPDHRFYRLVTPQQP